jgi:hypothetical protein
MTQVTDQPSSPTLSDSDLVTEVQRLLQGSPEPLTLAKIRSALPPRLRSASLEALAEALRRQVAANVLVQYPKYRSQHDRFWDRPMQVHIAYLLRQTLEEGPLAWSELRRKLPDYAKTQAEAVLEEQVVQGLLHRHPPSSSRGGMRYGLQRPDPKEYLRAELTAAFGRLERIGFSQAQLREGAMDLLQEEEWATPSTQTGEPGPEKGAQIPGQPATVKAHASHEPAPGTVARPHVFQESQQITAPQVGMHPSPATLGEPRT